MLKLTTHQYEQILHALVLRRDLLTTQVNDNPLAAPASMIEIWKHLRMTCQQVIDKVCSEYPEAKDSYYDGAMDTPPLAQNF